MMCHIQWHVGWYVAAYVSWHVTGDLNKWIFLKQSYFKYLEFCNLVPKFLNTFFPFPPFLRVSNPLHIPSNHSLGFIRICQPTSLQPDILILGTSSQHICINCLAAWSFLKGVQLINGVSQTLDTLCFKVHSPPQMQYSLCIIPPSITLVLWIVLWISLLIKS